MLPGGHALKLARRKAAQNAVGCIICMIFVHNMFCKFDIDLKKLGYKLNYATQSLGNVVDEATILNPNIFKR